jgi:BclB C-terminal domain-containing protein
MATVLGGLANTQALIGFGGNGSVVAVGGIIDTTALNSFAFSAPRAGIITSIAAYYSVGAALALALSTITITAQLYSSATPDDSFAPIVGATVTLSPALTGAVSVGFITSGITTGLSIPVTAGTRLMMVFSPAVTAGLDIAAIISGFASAGVSIE